MCAVPQAVMVMPVEGGEIERQFHRQPHPALGEIDIFGKRVADDLGLLGDLLGHEVAMAALVDQHGRSLREDHRPRHRARRRQSKISLASRRQHRPVAVLEIGDAVGEGRERDGVGAQVHLTLAVADGERRTLAGGDQEVVLAGEQEGQRERSLEAGRALRAPLPAARAPAASDRLTR